MNHAQPTISVIIPVYNVQEFIEDCLQSLVNQTYTKIEIIVVNDQTPDDSMAIVEKFASQDSRIKIVNREKNGGLSAARNSGIDVATGHMMTFVDSDDYIATDCYQKVVDSLQKDTNLVIFSVLNFVHETGKQWKMPYFSVDTQRENWHWFSNATVWNKVYSTEIIHLKKIRFAEGLYHEDEDFWFKYAASTSLSVQNLKEELYFYRQRASSITSTGASRRDLPKIAKSMFDFTKEHQLIEEQSGFLAYRLNIFVKLVCAKLSGKEKISSLEELWQIMHQLNLSEQVLSQLLPLSQWLYLCRNKELVDYCYKLHTQQQAINTSHPNSLLGRAKKFIQGL